MIPSAELPLHTLFHVDTTGRLAPGMRIDLNPSKPSIFGENYLSQFTKAGVLEALTAGAEHQNVALLSDAAYREYYLELFRTHHPRVSQLALPSRFTSFFATTTVADAWRYVERHAFQGIPRIYAIRSSTPGTMLDMTWLDQRFPRDMSAFAYYYEHYWNGSQISTDEHLASHELRGTLFEVLVSTPVTVGQLMAG